MFTKAQISTKMHKKTRTGHAKDNEKHLNTNKHKQAQTSTYKLKQAQTSTNKLKQAKTSIIKHKQAKKYPYRRMGAEYP